MRAGVLAYPICFAICCGACFLTVDIYKIQLKTFLMLSNLALLFTTFHFFDGMLKFLGLPNFPTDLEETFKFNICFNFMTTVVFYLIKLVYGNSYWDGYNNNPDYYDIFVHGGLLVLLLLEHFIWKRHKPALRCDVFFMLIFGLIIVGGLYYLDFYASTSVYGFVRKFNEIELALFPVSVILLLMGGTRLHLVLVTLFKGTDESSKPLL